MLPGAEPTVISGVDTVDGPDCCAFVHPARKAVTVRMHAQRIGKNDLFTCFHRLLALSVASEIPCDDDKIRRGSRVLSQPEWGFPMTFAGKGLRKTGGSPVTGF